MMSPLTDEGITPRLICHFAVMEVCMLPPGQERRDN
jgi:hypothetical protein